MTKFVLSRPGAPWDYPTLGFIATANGAILDGTLFDPDLTIPPDAFWSVYGGGSAETSITRYATPSEEFLDPTPETVAGWLLAYDTAANTYVATSPDDVIATAAWASTLTASYVGKVPAVDPLTAQAVHAPAPLFFSTYDGSGQTVEPAVCYIPEGFAGYKYWAAFTPYPQGDGDHENLSIYHSNDGIEWTVPAGVTNPIIARFPLPDGQCGDPEIVYDPSTGKLHAYIWQTADRTIPFSTMTWNYLHTESTDGVTWSAHNIAMTTVAMSTQGGGIAWDGSTWNLWVVSEVAPHGTIYRVQSNDLSTFNWATRQACTMTGWPTGWLAWENHVEQIGDTWVMTIQASNNSGVNYSLFFMTSLDGLTWTVNPTPILAPGPTGSWDESIIYRGDMAVLEGSNGEPRLALWYSARDTDITWGIGRTEITFNGRIPESPSGRMFRRRYVPSLEGKGSPEGVVEGPAGAEYLDRLGYSRTAPNTGAQLWIKTTDFTTPDTGWKPVYADTGLRNITALMPSAVRTSNPDMKLYIRRVRDQVTVMVEEAAAGSGTGTLTLLDGADMTTSLGMFGFSPAPVASSFPAPVFSDASGLLIATASLYIARSPTARLFGATAVPQRASVTWTTGDAWPTTLPGTLVVT